MHTMRDASTTGRRSRLAAIGLTILLGWAGLLPACSTPAEIAGGNGTPVDTLVADCTGEFQTADTDAPASFMVDGTRLIMTGVYVDATTAILLAALEANPQIRTIVMANVGGSDVSNDDNLEGGREIRTRNINTCVPEGGLVASGGTDFFIAGARRLVMAGGRVGVHSWEDSDDDGTVVQGINVPRTDPLHQPFTAFYSQMGIPEDFYWFTLQAAPASGMHFMTREELVRFGLVTQ